jgi:hypothetical protein
VWDLLTALEGVFVHLNSLEDLPKWDEPHMINQIKADFNRIPSVGAVVGHYSRIAKEESDQLRRETENKVWKGCAP